MIRNPNRTRDLFGGKGSRLSGPPVTRLMTWVSLATLLVTIALTHVGVRMALQGWTSSLSDSLGRRLAAICQADLPRLQATFRQSVTQRSVRHFDALARDLLSRDDVIIGAVLLNQHGTPFVGHTPQYRPRLEKDLKAETRGMALSQPLQGRRNLPRRSLVPEIYERDDVVEVIVQVEESPQRDALTPRLGYVRLVATVATMRDREFWTIWGISAALTLLILGHAIALIAVVRRTVVFPLERSLRFLRDGISDLYSVPKIRVRKSDALEVRRLINAMRMALFEIAFRHRTRDLFEDTRRIFDDYNEDYYLRLCRGAWLRSGLTKKCQLVVSRYQASTGQYSIEKTSQNEDETVTRTRTRSGETAFRPDPAGGLLDQTIFDFLASSEETQWQKDTLRAKVTLTGQYQGMSILLSLVPSSDMAMDRFEELTVSWLEVLAKLHQNVLMQSLTRRLDLARELHRKWITTSLSTENSPNIDFADVHAADLIPSIQVNGDLLFVCRFSGSSTSLTFLGDVRCDGDNRFREGLLASEIMAVLISRFGTLNEREPSRALLTEILQTTNHYITTTHGGQASIGCLGVLFDHATGAGVSICRGLRHPLLLTPHERKPLSIAPSLGSSDPLGTEASPTLEPHEFTLFPGQILFAATNGFFDATGHNDQPFERSVRSGCLAETTDALFMESAKTLLIQYFERLSKTLGDKPVEEDLTALVLKRRIKAGDF